MSSKNEKLIAVFGATGRQGGGVVRALQADRQFKVRALSRTPGKHRDLAEEVVATSSPEPSHNRMRQAMASICPSSVTS